MWVRGLKLDASGQHMQPSLVASYVGAWIETTAEHTEKI